jgi:hypothetical protein
VFILILVSLDVQLEVQHQPEEEEEVAAIQAAAELPAPVQALVFGGARPHTRRGSTVPQQPTRVSARFRALVDKPALVSLPYTGRTL